MAMTAHNDTLTLIVFLSYSGKWDILQAAKKMALEMLECSQWSRILRNTVRSMNARYEGLKKEQIIQSSKELTKAVS